MIYWYFVNALIFAFGLLEICAILFWLVFDETIGIFPLVSDFMWTSVKVHIGLFMIALTYAVYAAIQLAGV